MKKSAKVRSFLIAAIFVIGIGATACNSHNSQDPPLLPSPPSGANIQTAVSSNAV